MYQSASGVPQDAKLASALYVRSCDGGELVGCNDQGTVLELGLLGPVDVEGARMLYKRACDGGEKRGCRNIDRLERGGPADPSRDHAVNR
jgi:TPR repeat protein